MGKPKIKSEPISPKQDIKPFSLGSQPSSELKTNIKGVSKASLKKKVIKKNVKKTAAKRKSCDSGPTPAKKLKTFKFETLEEKNLKEDIKNDVLSECQSTSENLSNFNAKAEETFPECSVLQEWKNEELVAEISNVSERIARNVIKLLDQDCTIPFIARYRKEMTDDLTAERLRDVQDAYDTVKSLKKKVDTVVKTLKRENKLDLSLLKSLYNAKTLEEVEHLYAPYKPGSKRTLAERARKLGLEDVAHQLLDGTASLLSLQLYTFIQPDVKGLSSEEEVLNGIQHIIADVIAKDREILEYLRKMSNERNVSITSTKSTIAEKEDKKAFTEGRETNNFKFENYYNFNTSVKMVRAHQIMALNRGEKLKVLKVNIVIPPYMKNLTINRCIDKWGCPKGNNHDEWRYPKENIRDEQSAKFLKKCIDDAYDRLLEPHICRQIRSELTKQAEKESVAVFCTNLKHLLLTPPLRGKTVLGIDPGFKHGCKLAAVSHTGEVLQTDVIYLRNPSDTAKLKDLIINNKCEIIALGNGTACRDTETYLSNLIKANCFRPLDTKYCIINESGASIYSVTKEAEADLPNMDPNIRSAVSIARRLQDPLVEYVKVEPKHLGVGMYQHDISETVLKNALDGVVVECVSFVGVDLNVCSEIVLRKIAGLNAAKAKKIIEWREQNGSFKNRQQLLVVKGLGPKSFEQCAGFVKIFPQTCTPKKKAQSIKTELLDKTKTEATTKGRKKKVAEVPDSCNPLDMTIIHPESYSIAEKFLHDIGCSPVEIGQQSLIMKLASFVSSNFEDLEKKYGTSAQTMQLIVDALRQPLEYDIRAEFDKPLFKREVASIGDLKTGQIVTGKVTNTTHFGAFVDIGVGQDGLIHISKLRGRQVSLGDRVEVNVLSVDVKKKRIGLELRNKV